MIGAMKRASESNVIAMPYTVPEYWPENSLISGYSPPETKPCVAMLITSRTINAVRSQPMLGNMNMVTNEPINTTQ